MRPRVYLDTNVFIAAFEAGGSIHDHAWMLLNATEVGRVEAVTSELTLAELLSKPAHDAAQPTVVYDDIIATRPGLAVAAVDRTVLIEAASLRADGRALKLPDAIHLATAILCGCACVISSDIRLRHRSGPPTVGLDSNCLDAIDGLRL